MVSAEKKMMKEIVEGKNPGKYQWGCVCLAIDRLFIAARNYFCTLQKIKQHSRQSILPRPEERISPSFAALQTRT